jgi:hypothetical protein
MTTAQARRAISAQFSTDLLLVFIGSLEQDDVGLHHFDCRPDFWL